MAELVSKRLKSHVQNIYENKSYDDTASSSLRVLNHKKSIKKLAKLKFNMFGEKTHGYESSEDSDASSYESVIVEEKEVIEFTDEVIERLRAKKNFGIYQIDMVKTFRKIIREVDTDHSGEIDQLYICYTNFINTMKQEPKMEQVLPLSGEKVGSPDSSWDYIYEPEAKEVIDQLLTRYIESIIYHAIAENMASEQSSRMVAMKAASDNAGAVIDELTLVYNKARQAAITKEISEIVGGAAAVS